MPIMPVRLMIILPNRLIRCWAMPSLRLFWVIAQKPRGTHPTPVSTRYFNTLFCLVLHMAQRMAKRMAQRHRMQGYLPRLGRCLTAPRQVDLFPNVNTHCSSLFQFSRPIGTDCFSELPY
jgi:hypothetical protein